MNVKIKVRVPFLPLIQISCEIQRKQMGLFVKGFYERDESRWRRVLHACQYKAFRRQVPHRGGSCGVESTVRFSVANSQT